MRLGGLRRPLVGALVCSFAWFAGCGGPKTEGQVADDTTKNEVLMDAMAGYMNKRSGGKRAGKAAKESRVAAKEVKSD